MFNLKDKVALVTGSTRGIGKAIIESMASAGAKVVVSSRKADACEAVRAEFAARGQEAIAVPCNVGSKEDVKKLVDTVIAKWGRIDVLVCNAASNPHFGPMASASDEVFADGGARRRRHDHHFLHRRPARQQPARALRDLEGG
jgi:dehydrogenase/reductase SDR family member 4